MLHIDPGTGSLVIQAIAAALAVGGLAVRNYWHRITVFFGGRKQRSNDPGGSFEGSTIEDD